MDPNGNVYGPQRPLLGNSKVESDVELSCSDHQFSTLADQLGIEEVDTIHNFSTSRSVGSASSRNRQDPPTVILTQEQVETLIQTLQETGNALKQLTYVGRDLKPRRRYVNYISSLQYVHIFFCNLIIFIDFIFVKLTQFSNFLLLRFSK